MSRLPSPALPEMPKPDADEVVVSKSAKEVKTIKVKALRAGYMNGNRIVEGEVFEIKSKEELGSWMEIIEDGTKKSGK